MSPRAMKRALPLFVVIVGVASVVGCGDDDDGSGAPAGGAPGSGGSSSTGGQNKGGVGGHSTAGGQVGSQAGGGAGGDPTTAGQGGGGAGGHDGDVECHGEGDDAHSTQSLASFCARAGCDVSIDGTGFATNPGCNDDRRVTTGCGYVTLSQEAGAFASYFYFDATTEELVGAAFIDDVPGGPCQVFKHYAGFIPSACPEAASCLLCRNEDPDATPGPTLHLCGHEGGAGGGAGEGGAGGAGGSGGSGGTAN